jgi:hypothetical protein
MYSEDDIFNYSKGGDNTTQDLNYMNKKQLINLENDKSLSICSDYEDLSNQSGIRKIKDNHYKENTTKDLIDKDDLIFDIKYPLRLNIENSALSRIHKKEKSLGKNDDLLKFISDASGKII